MPQVEVNTLILDMMRVVVCHKETEVTLDTTKAVLCTRTTVVGRGTTEGTMLGVETNNNMATTFSTSSSTLAMRPRNTHQVSILGIRGTLATYKVPSQPQPPKGTTDMRTMRSIRVVVTILKRGILATRPTQICNAGLRWHNDRASVVRKGRSLT